MASEAVAKPSLALCDVTMGRLPGLSVSAQSSPSSGASRRCEATDFSHGARFKTRIAVGRRCESERCVIRPASFENESAEEEPAAGRREGGSDRGIKEE